jgi:CHAD domain-containing protein
MSETQTALQPAPPTQEPEAPASPKSFEEILRGQLGTLAEQHRLVIEVEDPEAIHKMRVTTRRTQASLDLLESPKERKRIRKLKRNLRQTRRMLSTVRNYDVFLEMTAREVATVRKSVKRQFELLSTVLQERRARRMAKVRDGLQRFNVGRLAEKIGISDYEVEEASPPSAEAVQQPESQDGPAFAVEPDASAMADSSDETTSSAPPAVDKPDSEPAKDRNDAASSQRDFDHRWIVLHAADRLDQRLAEFLVLAAQAHPATDPAELHQLRIAAKRVRYLLEIVSEMGYDHASRALTWLRALQDRIGDWHDLEALESEIVGIVSHQKFLKEHLLESSAMLQAADHLQHKKERLVARLFPVRPPKTLSVTCARISRALRRSAQTDSKPRPAGVHESPTSQL